MKPDVTAANEARSKVIALQGFIQNSIDDVAAKRKRNQFKATAVKVAILCLSGGATFLLGLNLGPGPDASMKNIAFAFTSAVTVLSALEPFFNYRALWVEHERANGSFFHVKDRLGFYVTGRKDDELDLDKLARFYDEYEQV